MRVVVVALLGAFAVSGSVFAAPLTTAPSKSVLVEVLITDKGIVIDKWVSSLTHNGLTTLAGPVPRGDYVSINVLNRGRKLHNFTIFGKTTPPIRPGRKAHLFVLANTRGSFRYRSTLDKGVSFRGTLIVA
jgi:hypothetical protein